MSYTGRRDFIHNELAGTLDGVEYNFDYDGFVDEMTKEGAIHHDVVTGWRFADNMDADHPELFDLFWGAVERYDAAAMEGVDPSTLRDMTES